MRIRLVAVGRLKAGSERELAERYRERAVALGRGLGFAGPDLAELAESRRRRAEDRQAEEAEGIRARAGEAPIAILDETAASLSSEDFARRLSDLQGRGDDLAFVIGGPDGLSPALRREAAWALSFGRLTLPHQLVRILVLEQTYRAFTIICGHPYHRGSAETP